jgi:hypothetical protein
VTRAGAAQADLQRMLETAGEAAWLSPQRRGALGDLDRYAVVAGQLGRVVENLRALGRGAVRAIDLGDSVPPEAIEAVEQLKAATAAMRGYLGGGEPEPVRESAIRAAGLANGVLDATGNLSAVHIVGQIRLAAADLLRATGLTREEAQEAVRAAWESAASSRSPI